MWVIRKKIDEAFTEEKSSGRKIVSITYEVGHYGPAADWYVHDSFCSLDYIEPTDAKTAANRACHYLNGGSARSSLLPKKPQEAPDAAD